MPIPFSKITLYIAFARSQTQQIEERQRRNIQKSRPYFEEKQLCQDQLQTQRNRITELESQIKRTKASYAASLKNLEQISEEIHRTRAADVGMVPPGPREPGVGAELCTDDDDEEEENGARYKAGRGQFHSSYHKMPTKNINSVPIADLINQYENDYSLDTTSLDAASIFSEDKDDDDDEPIVNECTGTPRHEPSKCSTVNSRNEPISAMSDNHELNLEELRHKVKELAVRPVEGGDGQTKDCWESELNETVNKLDRLMMLQENQREVTAPPSVVPVAKSVNHKSVSATETPIKTEKRPSSQATISSGISLHVHTAALPPLPPSATHTTKAFFNNSLQVVQQKMEELLPTAQPTTSSSNANAKELPLLSRISNEISANTANTVKVLKRRLSLN